MMSSRNLMMTGLALLTIAAVLTMFAASGPAQSANPTPTVPQLEQQITALEARVARLEAERAGVHPAGGTSPQPSPAPGSFNSTADAMPPGWHAGEINGIRFYTGRLSTQQSARPVP